MTPTDYVSLVLNETPWWAFAVLALLIFLGVQRLKPRVRPLASSFVAPVAFFVWGLFNANAYGQAQTPLLAGSILFGMMAAGWLSWRLVPSDIATLQPDNRFLFPATFEPLITYLCVFAVRFGLEVWAGFHPDVRPLAGGLAIGVSALVAGRTAGRAFSLLSVRQRAGQA